MSITDKLCTHAARNLWMKEPISVTIQEYRYIRSRFEVVINKINLLWENMFSPCKCDNSFYTWRKRTYVKIASEYILNKLHICCL